MTNDERSPIVQRNPSCPGARAQSATRYKKESTTKTRRHEEDSVRSDLGDVIGTVLRTRDHVRPVFVSVGHLIDLDTAASVVLESGGGFRIPEPTRRADRLVAAARSRSA